MAGGHHPSVNMVVNAFAALVFAALMFVFWWFLASRELRNTVQRKADVLRVARAQLAASESEELRDAATLLDLAVDRLERENRGSAAAHETARTRFNLWLGWTFIAPFLAAVLGLLLGFVTYNRVMTLRGAPRPMRFGHWFGLGAVLLSYIPEVLFFLFVVEHYAILGDYELVRYLMGGQ
jgi:hypothetical protein